MVVAEAVAAPDAEKKAVAAATNKNPVEILLVNRMKNRRGGKNDGYRKTGSNP